MAEKVSTGGNVSFQYQKGHSPRLKEKEKTEIEDAYAHADERKRREKKRKAIITMIIIILLLVVIFSYAILRG